MKRLSFVLSPFAAFAVAAVLTTSPAQAAEPQEIGKFGDWYAYTAQQDGKKVCYMGSEPIRSSGAPKNRGRVYFLITHRPDDGETGVPSYSAGFTISGGRDVTLKIGGKSFVLAPSGTDAFPDPTSDKAIVQGMIRGANMELAALGKGGKRTIDTFSLKGVTAAHRAIGKACKVR